MAESATKQAVILSPGRVKEQEFEVLRYEVVVPDGVTVDDLKNPLFWSTHAERFRQHTELRITPDNGTWMARAIVLQATRNWAKIFIESFHDLDKPEDIGDSDTFEVVWKGRHLKWCVIHKANQNIIKQELASRAEATNYMRDYEKTVK